MEHYVKVAEKRWSFREYDSEDRMLSLEKVPFEISFVDLYDEVDFNLIDTEDG